MRQENQDRWVLANINLSRTFFLPWQWKILPAWSAAISWYIWVYFSPFFFVYVRKLWLAARGVFMFWSLLIRSQGQKISESWGNKKVQVILFVLSDAISCYFIYFSFRLSRFSLASEIRGLCCPWKFNVFHVNKAEKN